jgi:fumarylacetoacetate (FAA) hydrolase family protein
MDEMQDFLKATLPADAQQATLIGRLWVEGKGPVLVRADHEALYDLSALAPTCSALLELPDAAAAVRAHRGERIAAIAEVIANSGADARVDERPWLLAPATCRP